MKTRKGALAVLIFAAATLGIIMIADQQKKRRAVLVQLLPDSQISDAIQLFSSVRKQDSSMEKMVGSNLEGIDRRAAIAKEKLARDQRKLRAIMHRIKQSHTPVRIAPDLHDQLHLVTAQYHVDLAKDLTHQLNGEYRSEYWPRAYDGSGGFDFASESDLSSPVTGGKAIEDVLATQGASKGLSEQEQWADRAIARRDGHS